MCVPWDIYNVYIIQASCCGEYCHIDTSHQSKAVDFVGDMTMSLYFFWFWHLGEKTQSTGKTQSDTV